MLKLNVSTLVDRLKTLRPSTQTLLFCLRQGGIVFVFLVGLYVVVPLLWDGIPLSPQQRVEPLKQRIDALDKQIKASPNPSTTDLKEIATLEKGRIDSENTIRTSLFQAVGGLLVFVTLYISWLTLKANEAKQVAERFSKAVEQLGNDNIHVRLGGIYALEQIAKDAEEKYYWQVIETLTSYVRERSPYPPKAAKTHSSFVQAAIKPTQTSESQPSEAIPPLPTDIQAVMTVLARRRHSYGHPLERHPLDLHGADLRRLELPSTTQLNQANLDGTNLQEADLYEVNLQEVSLWKANLQGARLYGINLQGAYLSEANLQGAKLSGANLQKTELGEANLQRAELYKANLRGASLMEANLRGASLMEADLQEAGLERVNLQEAQLWGASLREASFWGANLKGADLWKANLQGAKFTDAFGEALFNFQPVRTNSRPVWTNIRPEEATGLTWAQLNRAKSYEGAILPAYLQPQPQQSHTEVARSPQSEETLTAALNAIRVLGVSYKSE